MIIITDDPKSSSLQGCILRFIKKKWCITGQLMERDIILWKNNGLIKKQRNRKKKKKKSLFAWNIRNTHN